MKNIWFQRFGKFSGKYRDDVWFSKVAILQSLQILFGINLEWPSSLESKLWKNSLCCTRVLQGWGAAVLQKVKLILDLCEWCKFLCSCKKTSLVKTSSQLSCWSKVYSCNFIKSRLHHRGFSTWVLLKIFQIFLWDIFVIHFLRKLKASNP